MEIVVRSDAGDAELRLLGDHGRATLGELAECVLGHRGPSTLLVDDVHQPADRTFVDAGVRRGSVIDVSSRRPDDATTPAGRLVQVAGDGSGSSIELRDGSYRLGPTANGHAQHLRIGAVSAPMALLHVQGQLVEVEPVEGVPVRVAGNQLVERRAWTNGDLVVGDRVFIRTDRTASVIDRVDDERRHLTPVSIGRSLETEEDGTEVTVDPVGGIGVVGQPDDVLAMLRAITLDLAVRSWPHGTALGIRTAHPEAWDWTKWLPAVDTPAPTGASTRSTRRHVVVIDDGSVDDPRHRHEERVSVIAGATVQHLLPPGLAAIVHAFGADDPEPPLVVSVTTVADGTMAVRPRVAPYALDHATALRRAHRHARRWPDAGDLDPASARRVALGSDESDEPERLRLVAWAIAREPTALERRIERRCEQRGGDGRTRFRSSARGRRASPGDDDRPAPEDRPEVGSVPTETERVDSIADTAPTPHQRVLAAARAEPDRLVVPIGVWHGRDAVATVPLTAGRRLVVIGPERTDRSDLLVSIAEAIRHASEEIELFAVAPLGGSLVASPLVDHLRVDVARRPDDVRGWVDRVVASNRPVVVVDGADRVGGSGFARMADDDLAHATVVVASRGDLPPGHWSDRRGDRPLVVRIESVPGSAVLDTPHRQRRFSFDVAADRAGDTPLGGDERVWEGGS